MSDLMTPIYWIGDVDSESALCTVYGGRLFQVIYFSRAEALGCAAEMIMKKPDMNTVVGCTEYRELLEMANKFQQGLYFPETGEYIDAK